MARFGWEKEPVNIGYVREMDGEGIAVDLNRIVRDLHNPENSVRCDSRTKIVYL
jgi:hypothetical protein